MRKKTKLIKQYSGNDCGPAALLTLFRYFQIDVSLYTIKQLSDVKDDGTSMYSLVHIAKSFGFDPNAYQTDSIEKLKTIKHPFIINIIREGEQHFTVVDHIQDHKIVIADPLDGYYKLSYDDFMDVFTGFILFLIPNKQKINNVITEHKREKIHSGLLKKNIGKIILIIFATIIMNGINFINIFYFQRLMDDIVPLNNLRSLNLFSMLLIGLFLVAALFSFLRTRLIILLSQALERSLVVSFLKHVIRLPMSFFDSINAGEIIARTNDIYKVRDAIATVAITFLLDMFMLFVGAGVLIYLNASMFFIILCLLPIYTGLFIYFHQKYQKYNLKEMEKNAEIDSFLVQGITNMVDIKANTVETSYFKTYRAKFKEVLKRRFDLENTENREASIRMFIDSVTGLAILWFGAYQVIIDQLSIGGLIAFMALLSYFLGPLNRLIGMHPLISSARVAVRRIQDIFMIHAESTVDGIQKDMLFQSITFQNVGLDYFGDEIIAPLSIHVEKNATLVISGRSGSGKTSLAKMLMKFLEPTEGDIFIDDVNINNVNTPYLRNHIAYVGDAPFFFNGSIYENLTFGLTEIPTNNEIMDLCQKMGINELIENLPNGLQSKLQDDAQNISSGQKQRLYLVKTLLTRPSIIILDEATNHLDRETETSILDNLTDIKVKQGLILIIINHNEETWHYADKQIEIDKEVCK